MLNPFLILSAVLFQTIQLKKKQSLNVKKHFYFKQLSLDKIVFPLRTANCENSLFQTI